MTESKLTPKEQAIYDVLALQPGRLMSRAELARRAGLCDLNPRRCDSIVAGIRKTIGTERIVTVRQRGWMLVDNPAGLHSSTNSYLDEVPTS